MRALFVLLIVLLTFMQGAVWASAEQGAIRLGIEAVDSELAYFDLTLEPGESTELTIRLSNHGEIGTGASVFVADVYTLHGGGMGMAEIGEPRTGPSEWVNLETAEIQLDSGESVEEIFSVSVPEGTSPGDYTTSIVIQNTEPIEIGDEDGRFDQSVRQGIAVAIDVPGEREPALEIGEVTHSVTGERSVIEVGVQNSGNTHLRPAGAFELRDSDAREIASTSVELDTVFAGTDTVVEIVFSSQISPGSYSVFLSLADDEAGAQAESDDLTFVIEEPERDDDAEATGALRPADETVSENQGTFALIIGGVLLLVGIIVIALALLLRSSGPRMPVSEAFPNPAPHPQKPASRPAERRNTPPIRQLKPPGR